MIKIIGKQPLLKLKSVSVYTCIYDLSKVSSGGGPARSRGAGQAPARAQQVCKHTSHSTEIAAFNHGLDILQKCAKLCPIGINGLWRYNTIRIKAQMSCFCDNSFFDKPPGALPTIKNHIENHKKPHKTIKNHRKPSKTIDKHRKPS